MSWKGSCLLAAGSHRQGDTETADKQFARRPDGEQSFCEVLEDRPSGSCCSCRDPCSGDNPSPPRR